MGTSAGKTGNRNDSENSARTGKGRNCAEGHRGRAGARMREFRIEKRDVMKHGPTDGCPGCNKCDDRRESDKS